MPIILNAGYEGDIGAIFTGKVSQVSDKHSGTEVITTIAAAEALEEWLSKEVNKTYTAGSKASAIVKDLLNIFGLEVGTMELAVDKEYPRGKVCKGKVKNVLTEIVTSDCKSRFLIRNGIVTINDPKTGTKTGYVLSAESGLLKAAEATDRTETTTRQTTVKDGKEKQEVTYKRECLLNYHLAPADVVKIKSDTEIGAEGTVMVPFRCTSTGPDGNVAADTITTITNPGSVAGITAVTNPAAFTGGRERETDEEFRDRYYASVDYAGGVNADSIRAALLQNVDGIMEAKVFENDTDDVDDYGLPPHSIEAVVYGGLDSDIAQIIYKELGAGIQTTGQKVVKVITASGATKAIHFNRPHPVPVYVKVVGLSTSGDFPHDGVDQLRAAIVAYIGDNESGGVSIGETLYHQRLPAVLYKVPGVLDFDVLIGTDAENLQADNIPVDSRSKVVTDDGMVTIDA